MIENPVLLPISFSKICPHPPLARSSSCPLAPASPGRPRPVPALQEGTLIYNSCLMLRCLRLQSSFTDIFSFDIRSLRSSKIWLLEFSCYRKQSFKKFKLSNIIELTVADAEIELGSPDCPALSIPII